MNISDEKYNQTCVIQKMIERKLNREGPTFATENSTIITDIDSFPYRKFWRGWKDESPIIWNRQAGVCLLDNQTYTGQKSDCDETSDVCWQYPCSTVFPCRR